VFFEALSNHPSDLTVSGANEPIESVNHSSAGGGNPLIAKYNQLRPPVAIKELLRRAANQSPIPRILIPM
jgi:hypothetical protein